MAQELPGADRFDEGGEDPCYLHLIDQREDLASRADVEHLVRDFYRQAAMDDLLGPIFEAAISDWNHHIDKLTDFWVWQLFGTRGYAGNPLLAHKPVHQQTPFRHEHYRRWLELFTETVDLDYVGPVAEAAKQRATKMANALHRLIDGGSERSDGPVQVTLGPTNG